MCILWSHNVYYGLTLLGLETHTNQELPMVCVVVISASYIFRLAIHLHRLKGLIPSFTLNDTIETSHKEKIIRCACHTCVCTVYNNGDTFIWRTLVREG